MILTTILEEEIETETERERERERERWKIREHFNILTKQVFSDSARARTKRPEIVIHLIGK